MEVLPTFGGALLSATLERLHQKLDYSMTSLDLHEEIHTALQKWLIFLPQIGDVLDDAEEKQRTDSSVKTWLDDLKDLAYDMEDILDLFKADFQMRTMTERPNQAGTVIKRPYQASTSKFTIKCISCFRHNNFVDSKTVSEVMEIAMRLQSMVERSEFRKLVSSTIQLRQRPKKTTERTLSTSLLESYVYVRDKEKEAIFQKLLNYEGNSEHQGFSVLPIVGMGGIGKTSLARLAYNNVGPENFQLKAWVCVSKEFDVREITRCILEALTGHMSDFKDLNLLQEKLKEELFDKKFLLVLDDVWNERIELWDTLKVPFKSGAPGSKIIITTRNIQVAEIMGGKDAVCYIDALNDDECLSILAQHALGVENFDAYPSLKDVGWEAVKRCKGLPWAAKILGGLLRGRVHPEDWNYILKNEMENLEVGGSAILPALWLSYRHLPPHLKQCFAYLAVFPKDHQFSREEIIFLWMADGLLQQQLGGENQMEDIGYRYFHELLLRSFFQRSSEDPSMFVMHDLIHDLAQHIAGETCFNLEHLLEAERSEVNFEKVRYLSFHPQEFDISEKFEVLNKMKSLRTFTHIDSSSTVCHLSSMVHDWLVELRCLRVLSLQYYQIRKLPDSIGNLKCLQYLNLSESRIESLPESIGDLLSLQTLMLQGCRMFSKFPTTIGNLIDLHHLDITNTPSLKAMPQVIANLKKLLTLPKFIVGKANGLRLSVLRNLFRLKGCLSILELQNVCDIQDARQANLHMIGGVDELLLQWTSNFDTFRYGRSYAEMEVLNSLKPHSRLERFTISFYGGEQFPSWIGDPSFRCLLYLKLSGCRRSTSLPSLGQLAALEELIIEGMDAIVVVDSEVYNGSFMALRTLKFHNMLNWEKWAFPTSTGVQFPWLVDLEISNCPKLVGKLPSQLFSLVKLVIRGCQKLSCPSVSLPSLQKLCIAECEPVLLNCMVDLTSLTTLQLEDILGLCCLPKSFTESLATLETLRIERCCELNCLWEEGVDVLKLTHLRSMTVTWCPKLVSLTSKEQDLLPSNLRYLKLSNCKNLKLLPDGIMVETDGHNNSNMLEWLIIHDCPSLESFPRGKLPTKLNRLEIAGCTDAESLPEGIFDNNSNIEDLLITRLPSLKFFPDDRLPAALKHFEIWDCYRLESISEMMLQHCTGLKWMEIWDCVNLKSLSFSCLPSLTRLCIERCDAIESFLPELSSCIPNIQYLKIEHCQNLKFLPNKMYNLKSLEELRVGGCPGIKSIPEGGMPPNLKVLYIDCENLDQHTQEWGLHALTSLDSFQIGSICPSENVLPSSLTTLWINAVPNLKSIPRGLLQNLSSLKELGISRCPNLRFLPRKGLPPLLGQLRILECPLLNPETFQEKGVNWPLISHIPSVRINGIQITPL